jgi:hypothetical protein
VQEAAVPVLSTWQNFYVIVGSASAALTGLMFVVVTLISGSSFRRSSEPIAAFSAPSVTHFCVALLIAAILCAPWPMLWNVGVLLGLCGLWGMIYVGIVLRRMRRQGDYTPVLEDWLWHTIFPFISYAALVVAGILLIAGVTPVLFITGGATVLLLFIGIHNSWDNVTYLIVEGSRRENNKQEQ